MTRRIDKETAHRRAAAPSIDFSLLPQSPDLQALRDEVEQLRAEQKARSAARSAPVAPPAPAAPAEPPARSPYRPRDEEGRTLDPLAPAEPPGPVPPPLPPPPPPLRAVTPVPARPASASPPANAPTAAAPIRQSQIPTLELPRTAEHAPAPRDHRALLEPAVTAQPDDRPEPAWVAPPPELASRPPGVDRHATLVSQPPDAAFFEGSAPLDADDVEGDVASWERHRWIRRLGALALVAVLVVAFTAIATVGFVTLYVESTTPVAAPPAAAP
jgi:hypothetical protein